jgi:glutamyl-tRNA reductase
MIDIAVPRDIEPSVREVPGVTLYDMDDLQREVARNMGSREAEAVRARQLVDQEVERFSQWLASLDVVPTIAALRSLGDDVVEQVLRENESRWESLSEADRERLAVMARAIVNRLLHEPTLRLKAAVDDDASYVYVQALRELFGLEVGGSALDESSGAEVTQLDSRRRKRS